MQIFKDKNACLNLFQKRTSYFFKILTLSECVFKKVINALTETVDV